MSRRKKNLVELEKKEGNIMNDKVVLENVETEIDLARVELEKVRADIEQKKHELKALPMREIEAEEMVIIKKQTLSPSKMALKEKIEKKKMYENQIVTGKFINRRSPGQSAKLTYMHYEDDPVKWYVFEDGKVYSIPRGFADEINEHYHTPRFIQKMEIMDPNAPSSSIHDVDTSNKKYSFVPVSF